MKNYELIDKSFTLVEEPSKNKYGQYFTPKDVADFMISLAEIDEKSKILEPSCGEGIFLQLLKNKGYNNITAYEIDKDLARDYDFVQYESFVSANIKEKYNLIIGNPPYIRWKNLEQELKEELSKSFIWNKYFNSLCDYLYIFILKSTQLLEENGQLIFICPEYWMNTTHSIGLRNYLVENGYFEKIFHFNETPIFSNASVSILIFKYIKSKQKKENVEVVKYFKNKVLTINTLNNLKDKNFNSEEIKRFNVKQFEYNKRWLLTNEDEIESLKKFEQSCYNSDTISTDLFGNNQSKKYNTIGDVCEIGNGMVSGLDKVFQLNGEVLTEKEELNTINVIKAKDLNPFIFNNITKYIFANDVKTEEELKLSYPSFYKNLFPNRGDLEKRYQYNRKINYWEWVFLRNYNLFNSNKPRIFVPCKERISNKDFFRFSFVNSGIFPTQDVTAIFLKDATKESIFYLLAFLNNHRVFGWLKNKGIVKGSIIEFSEKPISSIPFRKIDWNNKKEVAIHNNIAELTEYYIQNQDAMLLDKIEDLFDDLLN